MHCVYPRAFNKRVITITTPSNELEISTLASHRESRLRQDTLSALGNPAVVLSRLLSRFKARLLKTLKATKSQRGKATKLVETISASAKISEALNTRTT